MIALWLDLGNTRLKYWLIDDGKVIASDAKEHLKAPNELLMGLFGTFVRFHPGVCGYLKRAWRENQCQNCRYAQ